MLPKITAAPVTTDDFRVTLEEKPDIDHVCFYITVENLQVDDVSLPLKFLLNRTSIDIAKAEAKLWEEEEYD